VRVRKAAWLVHRGGKVCVLSASFFCFGKCQVSVCCVFPWQGVLVVTRLHESVPPTVFSTRHVPCSVKRQRGVS
jgi:hypothetical protein